MQIPNHKTKIVCTICPASSSEEVIKGLAGATGVGACLGMDFVKVNYPKKEGVKSAEIFKEAIKASGCTIVICSGGMSDEAEALLKSSMTRSTFQERRDSEI